jgi:hypothetical protein
MLATSELSLSSPIAVEDLASLHPILNFYTKYLEAFKDLFGTDPSRFYSANSLFRFPNGTELRGNTKIWAYYQQVYGNAFKQSPTIPITINITSGESDGVKTLVLECTRFLLGPDDEKVAELPQAFVYQIGPADEGAGTDGWQIHEIRCYYELGLIVKAAEKMGVDVKSWKYADI